MRELLTASYLATTDSVGTLHAAHPRLSPRARVLTAPVPPLSAFRIKWFRTRRLAAVYPASKVVCHTPRAVADCVRARPRVTPAAASTHAETRKH